MVRCAVIGMTSNKALKLPPPVHLAGSASYTRFQDKPREAEDLVAKKVQIRPDGHRRLLQWPAVDRYL